MGILIIISIIVQICLILTNIFGLPGNILAGLISLIWFFSGHLTLVQLMIIILIIILGEIIEFISAFLLGKSSGISNKSLIISIIIALLLGIIMAPLFFGLGAVLGSFIGAFFGVFLYELIIYRDLRVAFKRGVLVFRSRIIGTFVKFSLGILIVVFTAYFLL